MKKLSLLFFALGLVFLTITGSNCKKKPPVIVPLPADTITTQHKDTTGQDLAITVKESITATAKGVPNCAVYLINNFDDWSKFMQAPPNKVWPPKANYKVTTSGVDGTCAFAKVKPPSEKVKHTDFPGHSGGYVYYLVSYKVDKITGDTNYVTPGGAYDPVSSSIGGPTTIAINNFQGKPLTVSVIQQ
jgi:hypothetical protein